jgi:hypothetical protein
MRRDEVGGDAVDGRLMDAVAFGAGEGFSGKFDDDALKGRFSRGA